MVVVVVVVVVVARERCCVEAAVVVPVAVAGNDVSSSMESRSSLACARSSAVICWVGVRVVCEGN